MTRVWTEEQKAQAAETRAETKRKKEEHEARKAERDAAKPTPNTETTVGVLRTIPKDDAEVVSRPPSSNGFDWERAPLAEATARYADLKRELDKAGAIVLKRQSISKPQWTCWTQLHKDVVPVSVQRLCRKTGDDGRWAFRDDGVWKLVDGLRVPDPAFCCNTYCFEVYQKAKPMAALSRH